MPHPLMKHKNISRSQRKARTESMEDKDSESWGLVAGATVIMAGPVFGTI